MLILTMAWEDLGATGTLPRRLGTLDRWEEHWAVCSKISLSAKTPITPWWLHRRGNQ